MTFIPGLNTTRLVLPGRGGGNQRCGKSPHLESYGRSSINSGPIFGGERKQALEKRQQSKPEIQETDYKHEDDKVLSKMHSLLFIIL